MHLAMCRHCRAFRRQIETIARDALSVSRAFEAEPRSDFESRIVQALLQASDGG
jgi:hypothetical protein